VWGGGRLPPPLAPQTCQTQLKLHQQVLHIIFDQELQKKHRPEFVLGGLLLGDVRVGACVWGGGRLPPPFAPKTCQTQLKLQRQVLNIIFDQELQKKHRPEFVLGGLLLGDVRVCVRVCACVCVWGPATPSLCPPNLSDPTETPATGAKHHL